MPRLPVRFYHWAKIGIDAILLTVAFVVAYWARFEGNISNVHREILWASLPAVVLLKLAALMALGVFRLAWRCAGLAEIGLILRGLLVGSILLTLLRLGAEWADDIFPVGRFFLVPFGVILIDCALAVILMIGVRGYWRGRIERREKKHWILSKPLLRKALLVGTGPASVQLARELKARPQLCVDVQGLLAEDRQKIGMVMSGVRVVGAISDMAAVAEEFDTDRILIPLPEVGSRVREIVHLCQQAGLTPHVIDEGNDQKLKLSRIRQVSVEDLLRRAPVRLEGNVVPELIRGKVVMVSGAGGSIGSQLCREVCKHEPRRLILLEQAENNLFNIHRTLAAEFPGLPLTPAIADVCDADRLAQILRAYGPQVIFHAAAHKHVPMMEWNATEAIKNNVLGTKGLADLAHQFGVGHFVMVSTDKAVNPTSVMGVSKRVAEIYVQALAQHSKTCFVTVRFGNVLGSAGSVIPIFQEQIAAGGPVTVTHPDMKRYFMTIPEACQLILEAASLGKGGEIFVLDMGEPVKIVDLATDMIRLSGFEPGTEIEINFSGMRPGEKLFEELSLETEQAGRTRHPRIFTGRNANCDLELIRRKIDELRELVDGNNGLELRRKFQDIVPEYTFIPADVRTGSEETVRDMQIEKFETPSEVKRDVRRLPVRQ